MDNIDFLMRGTINDVDVRFAFTEAVDTVTKGIMVHGTDPVASHLFGRGMIVGALLSPLLEGDEKYSLKWDYEGEAGTIMVDTTADCNVRGMMTQGLLMDKVESEQELFGDRGMISLIKSEEGKILNSGTSEAGLLDVADDIAFFLSTSDQIETELTALLDFKSDPQNPVSVAAGFILQALPGCDLKRFEVLRKKLKTKELNNVLRSTSIQEEGKLCEIFKLLFDSDKSLEELKNNHRIVYEFGSTPAYKCSCSYDKMKQAVKVLSADELDHIFSQNDKPVIKCHFCLSEYSFTREELDK